LPLIFQSNRTTLLVLLLSTLTLPACDQVGGAFDKSPQSIRSISTPARELIDQSLSDITPGSLTDYHTHIVGISPQTIGTFVNEGWQSPFNPSGYVKFETYKSAAGIHGDDDIDRQYMRRFNSLIDHLPYPGRFGIMAFDYFHNEQGIIDKKLTTFHTPNDYVIGLARNNPDRYFPIISVHPYRKDAITRLEDYASQGIRFIKWLPNSMGIHPSPPQADLRQQLIDYYQVMKDNNMVLISHTGEEKATEAEEFQHLGNPVYLRLALDMGVKVVMAHLGSLGDCTEDESSVCKPGTPYIDIAIQMLQNPRYKNNLFADISAITQFNRLHVLDKIIDNTDIHDRLINGSDYPLPAVNFVIQTRALVRSGHISRKERGLLNEIYNINPLLFDYVLKRTLRHSETGKQLPASIFMKNDKLI
jgi:predicted TIM-barrel fold metal-dependent hydrolase